MLSTTKDILSEAVRGRYGVVGAHVGSGIEIDAAIEAAEEMRSPVILDIQLSELGICPEEFLKWAEVRCRVASVPVALNLDDSKSESDMLAVIRMGARSIIVNRSDCTFEQNAELSKKAVALAHETGISVEAELKGRGPDGQEDPLQLTTAEAAKIYASEVSPDCLAVAVRITHEDGQPGIDFERLREIRSAVGDMPLALHGSLGIPVEELSEACREGINKVNASKDLKAAELKAILTNSSEEGIFTRNESVLDQIREGLKSRLKDLMTAFGSKDRA